MLNGPIWIEVPSIKIWCDHSRRERPHIRWDFAWSSQSDEWCFWKLCGLETFRIWHSYSKSHFSWIIAWERPQINEIDVRLQSSSESSWSDLPRLVEVVSTGVERFRPGLHLRLEWESCDSEMYWENALRWSWLYRISHMRSPYCS